MSAILPPEALDAACLALNTWTWPDGGRGAVRDVVTTLLEAAAPAIEAAERERIRQLADHHEARATCLECGNVTLDPNPCCTTSRYFADLIGGES